MKADGRRPYTRLKRPGAGTGAGPILGRHVRHMWAGRGPRRHPGGWPRRHLRRGPGRRRGGPVGGGRGRSRRGRRGPWWRRPFLLCITGACRGKIGEQNEQYRCYPGSCLHSGSPFSGRKARRTGGLAQGVGLGGVLPLRAGSNAGQRSFHPTASSMPCRNRKTAKSQDLSRCTSRHNFTAVEKTLSTIYFRFILGLLKGIVGVCRAPPIDHRL